MLWCAPPPKLYLWPSHSVRKGTFPCKKLKLRYLCCLKAHYVALQWCKPNIRRVFLSRVMNGSVSGTCYFEKYMYMFEVHACWTLNIGLAFYRDAASMPGVADEHRSCAKRKRKGNSFPLCNNTVLPRGAQIELFSCISQYYIVHRIAPFLQSRSHTYIYMYTHVNVLSQFKYWPAGAPAWCMGTPLPAALPTPGPGRPPRPPLPPFLRSCLNKNTFTSSNAYLYHGINKLAHLKYNTHLYTQFRME